MERSSSRARVDSTNSKRTLPAVTLAVLGTFTVSVADRVVTHFPTDKVRALLAYLALEPLHPHRREVLAALFWPHTAEAAALKNLRLTLHRLRQTLDAAAPGLADALFLVTRQTVQLDTSRLTVDALRFQQALAASERHAHASLTACPDCLARLDEAMMLYRGEVLAGFALADAPAFEEWLLLRRESLQAQAMLALHKLATAFEQLGDYNRALSYVQRKLALDAYHEESHRQVMRLLASSGLTNQALAHYESCLQLLRKEIGAEPEAETVALAEQIRDGTFDKLNGAARQPVHLPATQPIILSPPHNLPAQLTRFVGREGELADLARYLQDPDVRLLTLVGTGGMGKTRLALAAARASLEFRVWSLDSSTAPESSDHHNAKRQTPRFQDGVFFVSLAPLSKAVELTFAVAAALRLRLQGADPQQALCSFLRTKRLLLVLDNFEHLLPGALHRDQEGDEQSAIRLVVEWLQAAPGLTILVTSRERLNVRGEYLYGVGGMDYAADASLTAAIAAPAIQLFRQSVRQVRTDFVVNAANVAAVLRICQLLDGMPLGIEMAAAWANQLPPSEIARQIERSADFLTTNWADVPIRQRSMRATFDWSWRLLQPVEQRVLRQLAVIRGGFTQEAAATIAGATLPILTSLVHKSLLRRTEDRYTSHELLRQFAEEQLLHAGDERTAAEARHSDYYLSFVAAREARLARHDPGQAADEIEVEIYNIRQAWTWAVTHLQLEAIERCAYGLWHYYSLTGLIGEGDQLFSLAITSIAQATQAPTQTKVDQSLLSKLLTMYACLLHQQSKHDEAIRYAEQAVAVADEAHRAVLAFGYCIWGMTLSVTPEKQKARALLEQALHLAVEVQCSDPTNEFACEVEWLAHLHLGYSLRQMEEYAAAKDHVRQALHSCQRFGKLRGELLCLRNLGAIYLFAGQYATARQLYEQVLDYTDTLGYRWAAGINLVEFGVAVQMLGEYGLAGSLLEQGRALTHEIGDEYNECKALVMLARLYSYLGAYEQAHAWLNQASTYINDSRNNTINKEELIVRAVLANQRGDHLQALAAAMHAWQSAGETESRSDRARMLVFLGHAQAGLRHWSAAVDSYRQAFTLYCQVDKRAQAVEASAGLAAVALAQGELESALEAVEAILPVLDEHLQVGIDEPFYTYWVCHQVLTAHQDVRAAMILHLAHTRLQNYIEHIPDETLRRSFLEHVPVHRALHETYQNHQTTPTPKPHPTSFVET